jgi:thiopurine S-methyltransferase
VDWLQRWQENKIGWHKNEINARLIKFLSQLNLNVGGTIFVPLCGKSLDMLYLAEQGFKVVGVEISKKAIIDFFTENNIPYQQQNDNFISENISIINKSFFELTATDLSGVKAVYDRASLVALDKPTRQTYAQHLATITQQCPILLLALDYDQDKLAGPPFAVSPDEVGELFSDYQITQLESFNDIANETKFISSGLKAINKDSYYLSQALLASNS